MRLEAIIHNRDECSHFEDWSTEVLRAKVLSSHEEADLTARGFKVFVFAIVLRLQQIALWIVTSFSTPQGKCVTK